MMNSASAMKDTPAGNAEKVWWPETESNRRRRAFPVSCGLLHLRFAQNRRAAEPEKGISGGQRRNRTADASLFRAALYQLSYLATLGVPTIHVG